jgi:hypothetical protein
MRPRRPLPRLVPVFVVAALIASGCATTVPGHPSAAVAPDAQLSVIGDSGSPIDTLIKNAIFDVTAFWQHEYPTIADGKALPPLKGGLYSIDGAAVVATGKVAGPAAKEACVAETPSFIVDNAAYCQADDSIVWDRDPKHVFGVFADRFGPLMVALSFAHEFGHAIQQRLGTLDTKLPTIDTESQADCAAGAFLATVVNGTAAHFHASSADVDRALNGYLQVRDVTPDSPRDISHGDGFDRLSAIDDGLNKGVQFCYAPSYFDRQFTERPFVSDSDLFSGGNEPLDQLLDPNDPSTDPNAGGLIPDLNRFWSGVATRRGSHWDAVHIAEAGHPPCVGGGSVEFGYCAPDNTVYYSTGFAQDAYDSLDQLEVDPRTGNATIAENQPADYALGTLFAMGWGMAAQHQFGAADLTTPAALLAAACDAGAYSKDVNVAPTATTGQFVLSPPDMDEATSAMLNLVGDVRAYGSRGTSGLQRVQSFVTGYNGGVAAC